MKCPFSREQLLEKGYDPLSDPTSGLDLLEIEASHKEYLKQHGWDAVDHIAAVRGVLVKRDGKYEWLWDWGKLHDEIFAETGFGIQAYRGKFRNQKFHMPRVELFEMVNAREALLELLQCSPIEMDDLLNIDTAVGFYASIAEVIGGSF